MRRASLVLVLVAAGCLIGAQRGVAQEVAEDSVQFHHTLGEIIVGAQGEPAEFRSPRSIQRLPLAAIAISDAPTIDGLMRRIGGAHVQTNSRGETLVYVRGAGERQLAVFFDGALLNVPWDNRVDLAIVPTEMIGEVVISKSVPSVLYGTNVLGGALNVTSRESWGEDGLTQVAVTGGSQGARRGNLMHMRRRGRLSYGIAGGLYSRDGAPLSEGATLPFGQHSRSRRTNSDLESRTVFGRVSYGSEDGASAGITLLRLAGRKGVSPEGHLNPIVDRVRYWRYPSRFTTMLIGATRIPIGKTELRGTIWSGAYGQEIVQYRSAAYLVPSAEQQDQDLTVGTRLAMRVHLGRGELDVAVNALTSAHDQTDTEHRAGSTTAQSQYYRQHIWSTGAEYVRRGRLQATIGASLEGIVTPQTGGKPARGPQTSYGLLAGLRHSTGGPWTLRAVLGRKVRFPTMRELFDGALGRFLVNENLRPESSLAAEIAAAWNSSPVRISAAGFLQRTYDTIDLRIVNTGGMMGTKRQRINLDGSRVAGLEVNLASGQLRGLTIDGNFTWMRPIAFDGQSTMPLVERPEVLGHGTISYRHHSGASLVLEAVGTGKAHGLAEDNTRAPLPSSVAFNGRLGWLLVTGTHNIQLFTRVNNVTDEVVLPQLGLPAPGREVMGGFELSF